MGEKWICNCGQIFKDKSELADHMADLMEKGVKIHAAKRIDEQ